MRFPLFDVKYGLPVVGVWSRLWQVFLRDEGERWMLERVRTGGRVARWPTPATCLPAESSQARARGTVKGGRTQVVTSQTWG